ncbi:TetR/AcrR family transcriptional regulator [Thalassotalea crassostreae]|uniref:TetR/AcrR family transcriptional regulator n=1 Tax=Thalassotalea crassostreae TaxID=1763536 RepID=UPI000837FCC4|nr:TetR/AcrR family transcriptional regulator [Thalassotalea crassostreae]
MKTREKIIHASIELFNAEGERNITTNHIASHLGISPGNLYYHFRNKEDIIFAIYSEYADDLINEFKSMDTLDKNPLNSIMRYMDIVFALISKFRFFYSNLPVLLAKNPALKKRYSEIQKDIIVKVRTMLVSLKDADIIAIKDEEISDLTTLVRITTTFWLSYLQTQSEDITIDDVSLYEGLLKIFALFSPYVTENAREEFEQAREHYRNLQQQVQQDLAV